MDKNYISHLKGLLGTTGWTQGELAKRLGVTHAALNRWLQGHAVPHARRQAAIATLYKALVGFPPLPAAERQRIMVKARALRRLHLWEIIGKNDALLEELLLEHTYNSNAIEGSTLTKKETEAVIFDKSRLPDKSLTEHLEAVNHAAVLREIFQRRYPGTITEELIRRFHRLLLQGIREDAGAYATTPRTIRGVELATTPPEEIPAMMRTLLAGWKSREPRGYGLEEIATFHAAFERIHPFADGNGRVGRLVMLMQLLAAHYPPVVIEQARKAEYYEVLEHAQRASVEPFLGFLLEEMGRTTALLAKHRLPTLKK